MCDFDQSSSCFQLNSTQACYSTSTVKECPPNNDTAPTPDSPIENLSPSLLVQGDRRQNQKHGVFAGPDSFDNPATETILLSSLESHISDICTVGPVSLRDRSQNSSERLLEAVDIAERQGQCCDGHSGAHAETKVKQIVIPDLSLMSKCIDPALNNASFSPAKTLSRDDLG